MFKQRFFSIYKKCFNSLYGTRISDSKIVAKVGRKIHSVVKPEYVEIHGNKIFLDKNDHFLLSIKKYPIHKVIRELIKSGNIVIDVGANIGIFSLYFAKIVNNDGTVFVFEPEPNNFALLEKNVKENQYNNIILEQKAVSNFSGKTHLELGTIGAHRISNKPNENSIEVDCTSLDDYFKNFEKRIDLIKIDTEGYDWAVIEGAKSLIEKNNELKLITEFHTSLLKKSGKTPEYLIELIQSLGFKIYDLGGLMDKFIPLNSKNIPDFIKIPNSTNLLCTKEILTSYDF